MKYSFYKSLNLGIIKQGSYRDLTNINGKYAELYTRHAKRYLEKEKS